VVGHEFDGIALGISRKNSAPTNPPKILNLIRHTFALEPLDYSSLFVEGQAER
jgi:hypothetical protein